ncbi:MAG: DUF4097 family beta strand repeat-containing protein [Gemmatimonadota bacterium]
MMTARIWSGVALVALAGLGVAPQAQAQDFNWAGRVADGGTLEVRGVNGAVRAQRATGGQARVTATKEGRRDDPSSVRIEVVEHAGGVTLCAIYPTPENASQPNTCTPGGGRNSVQNNDVKVEFTVWVPDNVRFAGHTVNGGIEARALRGPAELRTVNGSIDVETAGTAEAHTVNGGIRARVGSVAGSGTLSFETVNGEVEVWIPAGAAMDVNAGTVNGDIETDFPLSVQGRWGPRTMKGTINGGGRALRLNTVNGDISLHRG